MSFIAKPVTPDGLTGFDSLGQFWVGRREDHGVVHSPGADLRGARCAICLGLWEATSESLGDQIRWSLTNEYVHHSCLARHAGFIERRTALNALLKARVRFRGLTPIPNGYFRETDRWGKWTPWYQTELIEHPYVFTIGHRKRVWEVRLVPGSGTIPWWEAAKELFLSEDVTKKFSDKEILVHAWGDERLDAYVGKIALAGRLGIAI